MVQSSDLFDFAIFPFALFTRVQKNNENILFTDSDPINQDELDFLSWVKYVIVHAFLLKHFAN